MDLATRSVNNCSSLLDVVYIDRSDLIPCAVLFPPISDHEGIGISLGISWKRPKSRKKKKYQFDNISSSTSFRFVSISPQHWNATNARVLCLYSQFGNRMNACDVCFFSVPPKIFHPPFLLPPNYDIMPRMYNNAWLINLTTKSLSAYKKPCHQYFLNLRKCMQSSPILILYSWCLWINIMVKIMLLVKANLAYSAIAVFRVWKSTWIFLLAREWRSWFIQKGHL